MKKTEKLLKKRHPRISVCGRQETCFGLPLFTVLKNVSISMDLDYSNPTEDYLSDRKPLLSVTGGEKKKAVLFWRTQWLLPLYLNLHLNR